MTAREMQIAWEAWFDHADRDHELQSDEIFRYLNEAQDEVVQEMFAQFEQDQIITDDLRVLIEKDKDVNALYAGADSGIGSFVADYATLPIDLRYLISSRVEVKYNQAGLTFTLETKDQARTISSSSTTLVVVTRISQSDDIYRLLHDPFNKSIFSDPIGVVNDSRLIVFTESTFMAERFFLDYLRDPNQISLTGPVPSELPDNVHKVIVDRAIDRFLQRSSILIPNQTQG